jgi:3-oxoacyl-[acyl-carrier-protein] synthase II
MTLLDDVRVDAKARGEPSAGTGRSRCVPRVAVRKWSARTVFGDLGETWDALLSGRHISDHARIPGVTGTGRLKQAAAMRVMLADGIDPDAALVVGTSKGSVEDWLNGHVWPTGLADVAAAITALNCLRGPRLTVSAACASGLLALIRGALLIRFGEARQVLVVAAEASVHPLFLGSFQRLGVLAKPGDGCRPFDRRRSGFYMSEAVATVLLEADGESEPACGTVYVDRFAFGGDAAHLTGGDPHLLTLRRLLRDVVDGRPVDLVHAHGTGTPANDEAELAAIESALVGGHGRPAVFSHKGAIGHSLGAAGLLSVVINCQAHATGTVPPNVQTREPVPTSRVVLARDVVQRPIRRSLAIAAGFGGATAVVSLRS